MQSLPVYLQSQLSSLAPITGISVNGDGTYTPSYDGTQTDAQVAAVQTFLSTFDPTAWWNTQNFVAQVQILLDATDTTMHRLVEAVSLGATTFTDPGAVAFVNYRRALRALQKAGSGTIPTTPGFPVGT